jgi:hypothetical protein
MLKEHGNIFIGGIYWPKDKVEQFNAEGAAARAETEAAEVVKNERREVFHQVARALGLPPYSMFTRPPLKDDSEGPRPAPLKQGPAGARERLSSKPLEPLPRARKTANKSSECSGSPMMGLAGDENFRC